MDARRQPAEIQPRQRDLIGNRLPLDLGEHRRRGRHGFDERAARDLGEPLLDELTRAIEVDVAGDDEAGIVGGVIALEELRDVLLRGSGQVLHVPDDGPAVWVRRRPQHP
ncbi:hypothetical protein D3C83_31780 [compost metagenome]